MSHYQKNNIIFYSILLLIIIASIGTTFFAIKKHNENVDKNKVTNKEEVIPYLTFKSVSKSDTVDVFKKYPINPLKFNYTNNKVSISGLKNLEIETKINNKLSTLELTKDNEGNSYCHINFNVSNILGINCNNKTLNINLVTGEELTLEEIFNKDTDLYSIIVKSDYDYICSWSGCYPDEEVTDDYNSNVENRIVAYLKNIKNNNYTIDLYETEVYINYGSYIDDLGTSIPFSNFKDEVTIYDRFLDDSIYINKVEDYCYPNNCFSKLNGSSKDIYNEENYLNNKTYLTFQIMNNSDNDPYYTTKASKTNFDLPNLSKLIKEEIIKKENLDTEGNNYVDLNINANIYYHTETDYQVTYDITKNEYTKESFIKNRLGSYETGTLLNRQINKINMIMDKNQKITYLSDNPKKDIPNFETKLYEFIESELDKEENGFSGYNNCEFADNYDECIAKRDYHILIKEASYAIDEVNNKLYIYEIKPGIGMAESYVNTFVSLDIFKENKPENNEDTIEE